MSTQMQRFQIQNCEALSIDGFEESDGICLENYVEHFQSDRKGS